MIGSLQEVLVTVNGGYSPDRLLVRRGIPLRIVFDRQESGECTSRVVFPDFALNRALPAYAQTAVELTPARSGEFGFACGMNMVHGTLVVEPNGHQQAEVAHAPLSTLEEPGGEDAGAAEDRDAAERRAEIADLTRRVVIGAVLTAPVLFTVMAGRLVPVGILANHWVELALITPVMLYVGWPIHRIGWLSLIHRSAEMNALITIGTRRRSGTACSSPWSPGSFPRASATSTSRRSA